MRQLLSIAILLLSISSYAQQMHVGLLRTIKVKTLTITANEGSYLVYGDTTEIGKLESVTIQYKANGVGITSNGAYSIYDTISIRQEQASSSVKIKSTSPSSKTHYYNDNFEITKGSGRLRIVNVVSMNNYLAGVIESEGGGGRHLEYYKVQALMSRTYALKNKSRHKKEGFDVCDGVHCQAYHNKLRYTDRIMTAVKETVGFVLVDGRNNLVTSYFSANCGGQVCDAAYVWNNSIPYVEPFVDTFCIHTRQATWETFVEKDKWKAYLRDQFGVTEEIVGDQLYNFTQDDRRAFYIHPSLGIPLRDLRMKFRLKSTYFSTHLEGDRVIISGRGFGHGVGLCQEGAMEMAKSGYDYTQIARYYFHNVQILDAKKNNYFKQEGELN